MGRASMANDPSRPAVVSPVEPARLGAIVREHIDFVWRVLRRQGLSSADADDGVQRVFLVFRDKGGSVRPGEEKSFLFRVATFVARELRRGATRFEEVTDANVTPLASTLPRIAAADFLDKAMLGLDEDERSVFVLFEIEGLTMAEISSILDCPGGTVASRLRRARDKVKAAAASMAGAEGGGT